MKTSSRTPDGWPRRCPICRKDVFIEPSIPPGDAPCPHCGSLIWFKSSNPLKWASPHFEDQVDYVCDDVIWPESDWLGEEHWGFKIIDLIYKPICYIPGITAAICIGFNDGEPITAFVVLSLYILILLWNSSWLFPKIEHWMNKPEQSENILRDVAIGWALVPGPSVGIIFGSLLPMIENLPLTSLEGMLIGLVIGPLFASIQGVSILLLIEGIYRLFKHESLFFSQAK